VFIVALGLVVAFWSDIVELISGANRELRKQVKIQQEIQDQLEFEIKILETKKQILEAEGKLTKDITEDIKLKIEAQILSNEVELESLKTLQAKALARALEVTLVDRILGVTGLIRGLTKDELKDLNERNKLIQETTLSIEQSRLAIANLNKEEDKEKDDEREDVVSSGIAEQLERDRNILDKSLELQLEFLNKNLEIVQQNEDDKFKIQTDGLVKAAAARAKDRQDQINLDNALAQQEQDREQALADFKVNIGKSTLGLLGAIAREGSAVAKGVQVAQATIAGIESVINTFKTASASPITTFFPAYPFIQSGIAGAFSAVQIQKIISTDPSGGGGVASLTGGGGGQTAAPSFNLVAGSGTNQIAESLAGDPVPIRAFVVSSEVTSAQSLDRNTENEASFG